MALSLVSTSPALAVRGQKSGRVCGGESCPPKEVCGGESCPPKEANDSSDEGLWGMPEEILELIFKRLSIAALSSFRCVCRRCKEFRFAPPPSFTIMSKAGDQNPMFYSDPERKWMTLPSSSHVPSGGNWEFVDSDAGLVCFQCYIDGWFWLWVCNPVKPSLSRLIRPEYDRQDPRWMTVVPQAPKMKLQVNRASETYRIVATLDQIPCTAVYESASSSWTCHRGCRPGVGSKEFFVWGSKLYAYSTTQNLEEGYRWLAVFDARNPRWKGIPGKIPCEVNFPTNRFHLSNNKDVMLVLCSKRKSGRKSYRSYFAVWKLLDRDSNFAPDSFCELENWKKVDIESESAVVDLRGHRLASASFDGEHLCFAFRNDKVTRDSSGGYKCARYSLATKRWSEMPCRSDLGVSPGLFTWEPNADIDPS